jgi:outer membrane protein assembly factor BamB
LGLWIFAAAVAVASACSQLAADDWPQWNGSNYEMISRETGWSKDWNAQPPKEIWQKEIGTGFSSVSVVGDRLFTMGRQDDKDAVYCLNATTGDAIWTHTYACELLANMHEGGPGSTPTFSGGHVFTFSREGQVFCLDAADGKVVWSVNLPDITDVKRPGWGLTASPIVVDDKVILEAGRLVALNKNDGSLVWQTANRPAGYGSAIQFVHAGRSLVATLNNEGLLIVDPAGGKEVAFTEWKTSWSTNSTTPIYFNGMFFVSTGYNRGCAVFQFDGDKLTETFANREISNHMNNSVFYQDHIYGISGNSSAARNCKLVCMDAKTGEVNWSKRGCGCGSLIIADGHVLVLTDDGVVTCGPADPSGYSLAGKVQALSGKCWTVPVLANGHLFCRNAKGHLVCLELERDTSAGASN